jgi:hypothetical protein
MAVLRAIEGPKVIKVLKAIEGPKVIKVLEAQQVILAQLVLLVELEPEELLAPKAIGDQMGQLTQTLLLVLIV